MSDKKEKINKEIDKPTNEEKKSLEAAKPEEKAKEVKSGVNVNNESKTTETAKKKKGGRFRYGATSITIALLLIIAVIGVNFFLSWLSNNTAYMSFDISGKDLYTLTQETIDFIETVDEDITIRVLATEESFAANSTYYTQINELLKQYNLHRGNITIEYVDVAAQPNFQQEYPDETLSQGDLIIVCGEKYRLLTSTDLLEYEYDQTTGYYDVTAVIAEPSITSAILNVISEDQAKVTFLNGLGDYDASSLQTLLKSNNYEVEEKAILTEEIESDTDVLVLYAPTIDPTEESMEKIVQFLEEDGKTLLYVNPSNPTETPLLDSFLEEWGLAFGQGYVFETDGTYLPNTTSMFMSAYDYSDTTYIEGLKNSSNKLVLAEVIPVEILDESMATALFQTSESAGIIPFDAGEDFDMNSVELGMYIGGAISNKGSEGGSKLVAIGSQYMFSSSFLSTTAYNNSAYIINLLNIEADVTEQGIPIESKNSSAIELGIVSSQINGLTALFMFVLPILLVILGIVIWRVRRYK